jgi:hypothetical protein
MADTALVSQSVLEQMTVQPGACSVTQSIVELMVGLGISCGNPPEGRAGVIYSHTFPSGSGVAPLSFAITAGGLPPGLNLNASTGTAAGVPQSAGVFGFTVTVTDAESTSASVSCSITIIGTAGFYMSSAAGRVCPPVAPVRKIEWSTFQREFEELRPSDVEEVRVPEVSEW